MAVLAVALLRLGDIDVCNALQNLTERCEQRTESSCNQGAVGTSLNQLNCLKQCDRE